MNMNEQLTFHDDKPKVKASVEEVAERISPWIPTDDAETLACVGKLSEEAGELISRLSRVIIQGLDGIDPKSGKTNRHELEREIADVRAGIEQVEKRLELDRLVGREAIKSGGFDKWQLLIKASKGIHWKSTNVRVGVTEYTAWAVIPFGIGEKLPYRIIERASKGYKVYIRDEHIDTVSTYSAALFMVRELVREGRI